VPFDGGQCVNRGIVGNAEQGSLFNNHVSFDSLQTCDENPQPRNVIVSISHPALQTIKIDRVIMPGHMGDSGDASTAKA
jgi:hypothetical protein